MVTGFEEEQLRTNKALVHAIQNLREALHLQIAESKELRATIHELKVELEIANGLKRNFL